MRALVLGGGVAGLAGAIALCRSGHEVVLLEARARGQSSPRNAHVHRLDGGLVGGLKRLSPDLPERLKAAGAVVGRLGVARGGGLSWSGESLIADLDGIERALATSAAALGAEIIFGEAAETVVPVGSGWRVEGRNGRPITAEVLVDASGGARASMGMLDAHLPDIALDDLGDPQGYVSWRGLASCHDPCTVVFSGGGLEGLLQSGTDRTVRLTCRHDPGAALGMAPPLGRLWETGGEALTGLAVPGSFQDRPVRYLAPGARRVALEEADLSGLPPLILIGDALMQSPPRLGEGVRRAVDQALAVGEGLARGEAPRAIARALATASRQAWLGAGMIPLPA